MYTAEKLNTSGINGTEDAYKFKLNNNPYTK